jgi:hypothetical protein
VSNARVVVALLRILTWWTILDISCNFCKLVEASIDILILLEVQQLKTRSGQYLCLPQLDSTIQLGVFSSFEMCT